MLHRFGYWCDWSIGWLVRYILYFRLCWIKILHHTYIHWITYSCKMHKPHRFYRFDLISHFMRKVKRLAWFTQPLELCARFQILNSHENTHTNLSAHVNVLFFLGPLLNGFVFSLHNMCVCVFTWCRQVFEITNITLTLIVFLIIK